MGKKKGYEPKITLVDDIHPEEAYVEPVVEEVVEEVVEPEINIPTYTTNQSGTVIPHMLKVRTSCSTDSEVLKILRRDEKVEILDENTCNGWLPVLLADGTKGYCMSKFIK